MPAGNSKPNLSQVVRNNLGQFLLTFWDKEEKKLERGAITKASNQFGISIRAVHTIWNQCLECINVGLPIHLRNRKSGSIRRRQKVYDDDFFRTLALKKRKTVRRCAQALNVSLTTVWRWKRSKLIRAHSSAIRVSLTPSQKLQRLLFCLQALKVDTVTNKITFRSMQHTVHIDEKWFYLTKTSEKYYLSPTETDPHRTSVNKQYITKIMFLFAVCRPIYDSDGNEIFNGKIGMYPFTEKVAAQRRSVNRLAGTFETKAIQSVNREVTKFYMINKVLPDLKALWPITEHGMINIQQDNAPAHINDDDTEWREASSSDGFNIKLVNQPPKSPDLNINDLGWFRALQFLQEQTCSATIDELVNAVQLSFKEHDPMKLNFVYLTLQSAMIEIMKVSGNNNYRLVHMKKETLLREGRLPVDLEVDIQLVQECFDYLREVGMGQDLELILSDFQSIIT